VNLRSDIHRFSKIPTFRIQRFVTTCILLAAGACAHAATITGTVSDAESRAPLGGATVWLLQLARATAADSDGRFAFADVPPGDYSIVADAIAHRADTVRVHVPADESTVRVELRLRPRALTMAEIVVTARASRETDRAARETERDAPSIVSVLSAQTIDRYPDPTTAEAVQRIPGISITRVRGEAREPIVRGMEGRYNNTLIDGIKMPSPATESRVVQLDFLASSLLQRVEVTKQLTPDMEGDAIGGSVNLVMRTAPSRPLLQARLATGYGSRLLGEDFVGFRSDSVLEDPVEAHGQGYSAKPGDFTRDNLRLERSTAPPDLLGELTVGDRIAGGALGVVLAASVQRTLRNSETTRNFDAVDVDNVPYLVRKQYRFHSHDRLKAGVDAKADLILGMHDQLSLALNGFLRRNQESRQQNDSNYVYSPVLYQSSRTVVQTHLLGDAVLSGRHELSWADVEWRGGYAYARQDKPDRAELITSAAMVGDSVVTRPVFFAVLRDWQHNSDADAFAGADASLRAWREAGIDVKAGALVRLKNRDNYDNEYRLSPRLDSATAPLPYYTSIDELQWDVYNAAGTPQFASNNYTCRELVSAGYAMAMWRLGDLGILTGARVEATTSTYATNDASQMREVSVRKSYVDVLPSLHLRYALDEVSNVRLSLSRSLSRPSFYDLVPYNILGEEYREMGNPSLRRTTSTNVDLKVETFPTAEDQLSAGVFYKRIVDPIEMTIDVGNPAIPTLTPKNLGTATNFGAEVTAGILLAGRLNVQATYTWTHSEITTDKVYNDAPNNRVVLVPTTRPLQGQSEHIGNIALAYADTSWGTSAQLSFSYTGRRIVQVSIHPGLDHYQSALAGLDFAAEQKLAGGLSLLVRANNLLDAPYEVRIENGTVVEKETFGRFFTIGLNYTY
jgi:outer membrane receptor protein involved in Fe transport